VQEDAQLWEYTVLVTDVEHELSAIGQLYRDRCDCENGFDELKNQWGWGGFTTQDMHRSELTARAVALVYNWWSWYVRAANPQARREALTSRPLLLAAVGRATHSGGRTELHLTPMHAEVGLIKTMIANVGAAIAYVKRAAEQLPKVAVSMDGRGRTYDNIFVERLWRSVKHEDVYHNGYATMGELLLGLTKYFAFYNAERPHQSLGNQTPQEVHKTSSGGGAMIVDKYRTTERLPVTLRSSGTAFEEVKIENESAIPNAKTGAAPSSCEK
jgi:hypothetical protein